ncbi:MAG: hypothetical protein AAGA90_20525 [Actinomycetota bacterium]
MTVNVDQPIKMALVLMPIADLDAGTPPVGVLATEEHLRAIDWIPRDRYYDEFVALCEQADVSPGDVSMFRYVVEHLINGYVTDEDVTVGGDVLAWVRREAELDDDEVRVDVDE